MLRHVQDGTPEFRCGWVDAHRNPDVYFWTPRQERSPFVMRSRPVVELAGEVQTRDRPWLRFAQHLDKLNRETPASPPPARDTVIEPGTRDPKLTRPDVPRLGDVAPVERTTVERRIRAVYRIELPLRAGRVIDVLV